MNENLITINEAAEVLGVSRRTIYLLRDRPAFPKPVAFSTRTVRFVRSELLEYATSYCRQEHKYVPPQFQKKTEETKEGV
jgi:predicted DNA-binding transcriptional regulator AlpA